jgi:hypothetical protein
MVIKDVADDVEDDNLISLNLDRDSLAWNDSNRTLSRISGGIPIINKIIIR